jgi:predicted amidohydrolase YtcJ
MFPRSTLWASLVLGLLLLTAPATWAQSPSLQELGGQLAAEPLPPITLYTAKDIVTLDPARPHVEAIAVVGSRILATGTLAELREAAGDQPCRVDHTFRDKVIVPGFISQHDHPVLSALTLASEVLSIEEWMLPTGTIPAVRTKADFLERLTAAEKRLNDPAEPLLTWGYHESFFGKLTRAELDTISARRPILVWGRSCHELFLNSAALQAGGVTADVVSGWSPSEQAQSNFAQGHFWEQGVFAVGKHVAHMIATPERLERGLLLTRDYLHAKGITYGNEPGGILVKPLQDAVNAVFSQPTMPFRWSFMVDGKSLCDRYPDDARVLAESEKLRDWYGGMTSQAEKMVKLFADGAIYSQLMQVREPYLDGHAGAWMSDLPVFERAFRIYWDAGYQIHIHVNGDAGLDRVLNTLEKNQRRRPRFDHRTTIVHFAVSQPDQVARIRRLGCLVSGNPYYVTSLADNYGKVGLGPQRADEMVRMGDVERAGISFSYHSDMPMAPADPLFLMWCGVNRQTVSGRVAGAHQRVSREGALRAVTLDAAHSLKMERELGSLVSGKRANFTILDDNPVTCPPLHIRDIGVWGTVHEGMPRPAGQSRDGQARRTPDTAREAAFARAHRDAAEQIVAFEQAGGSLGGLLAGAANGHPPGAAAPRQPCPCGSPLLHALFADSPAHAIRSPSWD